MDFEEVVSRYIIQTINFVNYHFLQAYFQCLYSNMKKYPVVSFYYSGTVFCTAQSKDESEIQTDTQ